MSKTRDDSLVELTELLTQSDFCPHTVGLPSFVEGKSCPKKCRLCWETAIGFLYDGELARLKKEFSK